MQILRDISVQEFLLHAGPMLYREEDRYNLILGLCGLIGNPQNAMLLRIHNRDKLGVAIQIPPQNLVISDLKENEIERVVEFLIAQNIEIPGVVGPSCAAEIFANLWVRQHAVRSTLAMKQRLYKVETVKVPQVSGYLRLAKPEEVGLVTQWVYDFSLESLPPSEHKSLEDRRQQVELSIAKDFVFLWIDNQVPVSMAMINRPTRNGNSVGPVYTPKNYRNNGYASVVTAHVSQYMLERGKKFCVLYADAQNPTTNKIYQAIGYQKIEDSKHFIFSNI